MATSKRRRRAAPSANPTPAPDAGVDYAAFRTRSGVDQTSALFSRDLYAGRALSADATALLNALCAKLDDTAPGTGSWPCTPGFIAGHMDRRPVWVRSRLRRAGWYVSGTGDGRHLWRNRDELAIACSIIVDGTIPAAKPDAAAA